TTICRAHAAISENTLDAGRYIPIRLHSRLAFRARARRRNNDRRLIRLPVFKIHADPPAELSVELRRASDRLPGRVAAFHVLGIESGLPQRGRSAASDVKSVNTEHYHWIRFRQFRRPLLHALRVAPDGAFDDVLCTGYVVPRTRVDELDRLALIQHRPDIFHRDSRQISEL